MLKGQTKKKKRTQEENKKNGKEDQLLQWLVAHRSKMYRNLQPYSACS